MYTFLKNRNLSITEERFGLLVVIDYHIIITLRRKKRVSYWSHILSSGYSGPTSGLQSANRYTAHTGTRIPKCQVISHFADCESYAQRCRVRVIQRKWKYVTLKNEELLQGAISRMPCSWFSSKNAYSPIVQILIVFLNCEMTMTCYDK